MISFPKYNFVFVGIPKAATTSMEARLRQLGTADTNSQKFSLVEYPHAQHYNIREYRRILGDELDSRFKFAFVRNPWDKVVSSFTRECSNWRNPTMPRDWILDPKMFQEWVKTALIPPRRAPRRAPRRSSNRGRPFSRGYHRLTAEPQLNWITDERGNVAVDFIGRFENLVSDFDTALNRIDQNHPLPPRKHWTQRKLNVSHGATEHYSHYYNDETIERVRKVYQKDIEHFGYIFEHRRNYKDY